MRPLPLLLLLTACETGSIKLGDDSGAGPVVGDADGDGHAAVDAGGDDCDDADATVSPSAAEIWYDGVDQDCDGASDYDQDLDGEDQAPTGPDCDDADSTVHTGAVEIRDLADQDCDGLVDEDFVAAGDVVVSEVMHHPLAASDAYGEWFELTNVSAAAIDLAGWRITADDGDAVTIAGSLVVEAGARVVLGANSNTAYNGGVPVDYVYDRAQLSLSSDDSLFLVAATTVFDVEWTSAWTMTDGRTINLDPDHFAVGEARQSGFWCVASSALPSGDYGTPGAPNDDCSQLDEDGDGYSPDAGDCDDDDPDIAPGKTDVWDGIDNDCDGAPDGGEIDDVAGGSVDGPAGGFLGVHSGLGLGDVTGDGTPDYLVGGSVLNAYQGAVYVLSGERPLSGGVSTSAVATVSGTTYSYFGATSPLAGDVTGDGVADLVVASSAGMGGPGTSVTVLGVYEGGSGLVGARDASSADYSITGASPAGSAANRVLAHLDLNGDGLADIVYGQAGATSAKGEVAVFDAAALDGALTLDDADMILVGDSNQDMAGSGLGGADIDGDGYDDLLVGAMGVDDEADGAGGWYQVDGQAAWAGEIEVDAAESRTILGDERDAGIGFGPPALGDFDGDGAVDLAFGGVGADAVWVYYGLATRPTNLETDEADTILAGENDFGFAVAAADLDGDGVDALLVGAPARSGPWSSAAYWYATPGSDTGALYVFDARSLALGEVDADDAWASAEGETRGDLFGSLASGAMDVDGDGSEDLLLGAPRGGSSNTAGRVYLVNGR